MRKAVLILTILTFFPALSFSQTKVLNILHVGDTHSNLVTGGERDSSLTGDIGGLARAATVIGMAKQQDTNLLILHSGDMFTGDLLFNAFVGIPEWEWMKGMGFTAMTLGNHEFDITPRGLVQSLDEGFKNGSFPLISSNMIILDTDAVIQKLKNYVKPYIIKTVNGINIGIFGLTSPTANFFSLPSVFIDTNIVPITLSMVNELKSKNCDIIIMLSHLGFNIDALLAANVPKIDYIVSSHHHSQRQTPIIIKNPENKNTTIFQAGAYYHNVGVIRANIENTEINNTQYQIIPLIRNIPEEPNTKLLVAGLVANYETITKQPFFTQKVKEAGSTFSEVAGELLKPGSHDTPVGNLVTDSYTDFTHTDIGITVGGMTAQPLYKGPFTANDVFRMLGYGVNDVNGLGFRLAKFDISGGFLWLLINRVLQDIIVNDEQLVQVSGMKYEYYVDKEPRLKQVWIGKDTVEYTKIYTVTTNEYVYLYLKYSQAPIFNDTLLNDVTELQAVLNYINKINSPKIDPLVEGRIKGVTFAEVSEMSNNKNDFFLYPNPASEQVVVFNEIDGCQITDIAVYNALGNMVYSNKITQSYNGNKHQINVSNLSPGMYNVSIKTGTSRYFRKLVIIR